MNSTRISRYVNAPRAIVYRAPLERLTPEDKRHLKDHFLQECVLPGNRLREKHKIPIPIRGADPI